jgi:hypothetical protein
MNPSTVRLSLLAVSFCFATRAGAQNDSGPQPPVPGKSLPSQYLPTGLKLSIGGSSRPSYRLELQGQSLVYHVRQFDPEAFEVREVDRTITPSAGQWLRFWKAMDAVDLWRWQASYTDPDVDGINWTVDVAFGDRKAVSSGHGAFPTGHSDTDESPSDTDGLFKTYLHAVEDLLGGASFH